MNINQLLDKIKRRIGLNGVLKDLYDDNTLREIVLYSSLPEFNKYSGFNVTTTLDKILRYLGMVDYNDVRDYYDVEIRIPESITRPIYDNGSRIKTLMATPMPLYNSWKNPTLKENIYSLHLYNAQKNTRPTPKFSIIHPDIIKIDKYNRGAPDVYKNYKVTLICEHPPSLHTISVSLSRYFEQLCEYDIMISMYNNHLSFLSVEIGNGQINLELDHFKEAESNRRELLQQLSDKADIENMQFDFGL